LSPVELAHDAEGDGPPLVLIHAGVCDRRMWEPQWRALTERFRTVRCDLRGFGDSPLPPESFNNADDVLRLLDALGIERASVVGSSFGGRVALELACTWPERVERLVLLCSAWEGVDPDPALASFAAEENRLLDAGDVDGAVELNVRTWVGPDASDAARSLVERMQRRAFEVQLEAGDDVLDEERDVDPGAVRARALSVAGALDFPRFRQIAAALADRIPEAEHMELEWAGHLPSLERPDLVTELLLRSLDTSP
jgi:pimeloyl-ACP methyl ester carboxylesterase